VEPDGSAPPYDGCMEAAPLAAPCPTPGPRTLAIATAVIAALGVGAEIAGHVAGLPRRWVGLCSLSYEANLPTWYSSVLLLLCAQQLAGIARDAGARGDRWRRHWWGLAIGFVAMSIDEVAEVHEELSGLFDFRGAVHGALTFGWVIPAGALVAAIGVAYLRFLLALPADLRRRFLIAGALYVGGAVAMELPLGAITDAYGDESLAYALVDAVEETLEMIGAGYFLVALARAPVGAK